MANIITTIVQNSEGKTVVKQDFLGPFIEWLITISQLCFYMSFVTDLKLLQAKLIIDDMDLIKKRLRKVERIKLRREKDTQNKNMKN